MKHILLFLSLLLSLNFSAQGIKTFVSHQTTEYPKSHLLDLYKSCFQDYMGAEHLVSDIEGVKAYLKEELNATDINDLPEWYYEPCGIKGRYVRVSLRTVKEGHITEDMLLDAFIRSANTKHPSVKSWSRRWHKIIGTIEKMNLNLPDYDREKQFIDSLLSVDKYAISHSADYREAYHPHYRIVERRIFENELKPLIDKKQTHRLLTPIKKDVLPEHSPNVFLVMYDAEIGKEPLLKAIKDYKVEIIYDYNIINGMALKKPDNKSLEETMQYFKKVEGVTNVEYDNIIRLTDPVKPKLEIK
ncbi:MAG: hypothetical protein IJQ60_17880 [Prevotella sp.]|nr:hypothetical protein [Prevotella sp.]